MVFTFLDYLHTNNVNTFHKNSFKILASDISKTSLHKASHGVYSPAEVKRGLSQQQIKQYFNQSEASFRMKPEIKKMITFKHINLMQIPQSLGKFDLIFCRYVLIYMNHHEKMAILTRIIDKLNVGAYLILDPAIALKVHHPSLKNIRFRSQNIFKKISSQ